MPIDLRDAAPIRALAHMVPGGPRPGEVVWLVARAGVGKSSVLIHLALDRVLRGDSVLHVALRESVAHVRDAYDSVIGAVGRPADRPAAQLLVERHRVIHSSRQQPVGASRLSQLLDTLHDAMDFKPSVVVMDGHEPDAAEAQALKALAVARGLVLWVAFTPDAPVQPAGADYVLELVADRGAVWLRAVKGSNAADTRIAGLVGRDTVDPVGPVSAGQCTLYSGGAPGAESCFGEQAERFGVRETNFTFDGHVQARKRGAHPLTEQELAAGDVSLAYVSRRLRRGWGESASIKRVLQSLWHMVGAAQVVYVVGSIQEDGTVTGGTGWSVELARMWSKRLWVFDQEKNGWYRWTGDDWMPGEPVIDAPAICGTGTRYLAENGRKAIVDLFVRSFAE